MDLEHRPTVGVDPAVEGGLHRGGTRLQVAVEVLAEVVGLAHVVVVLVEHVALAAPGADPLHPLHEVGLEGVLEPLELLPGGPGLAELGEHRVDLRLHLLHRHPRLEGGLDHELGGELLARLEGGHVLGDLQLVHQAPVEPAGPALAQGLGREIELRVTRREERRGVPHEVHPGELHPVLEPEPVLAVELGHPLGDLVHRRSRGDLAVVLRDPLLHLGGVEVARDAQGGVVRRVVLAEEVLHVLEARRLQVLVLADHAVVVGVALRVEQPVALQPERGVGTPLALAALVAHHVPLVVQLLLGHGRQEPAHAVRLHEEHALEVVRGHHLPVVGPVLVGGAVDLAPDRLQGPEVLLVQVLGALEHHVLEQVGEPAPAGPLVLGPHVVPGVDRHHGGGVVDMEDHLEAVVQGVGLDVEGGEVRGLGTRTAEHGEGGAEEGQGDGATQHGETPSRGRRLRNRLGDRRIPPGADSRRPPPTFQPLGVYLVIWGSGSG